MRYFKTLNSSLRVTSNSLTHTFVPVQITPGNWIGLLATALNNAATGTPQVETATAAGTISTAGNVQVIVTAAGVTGSPITLSVAAALNDTAAQWAAKVRAALAANEAIAAKFAVSGTDASIVLTSLKGLANDATLNIALADGTSVGVTAAPSSANTTAGVVAGLISNGNVEEVLVAEYDALVAAAAAGYYTNTAGKVAAQKWAEVDCFPAS
jgi:hypothetical protein